MRLKHDLARRARAAGDEPLACETQGFTVQLLHAAGDAPAATALASEMRERAERLRSRFLISWSRYASGVILLDGDPEAARCWLALGSLIAARPDEPAAALLAATEDSPEAPLRASLALVTALANRAREQLAARMPPERLAAATAHGRTLDLTAAKALARAELSDLISEPVEP